MNLGKHTRLKIYNARLMLRSSIRELDESIEEVGNEEDAKTIEHWKLRLIGIDEALGEILAISNGGSIPP